MKHIKTVNKPSMQASLKTGGCDRIFSAVF